jgi:hypothetical protein
VVSLFLPSRPSWIFSTYLHLHLHLDLSRDSSQLGPSWTAPAPRVLLDVLALVPVLELDLVHPIQLEGNHSDRLCSCPWCPGRTEIEGGPKNPWSLLVVRFQSQFRFDIVLVVSILVPNLILLMLLMVMMMMM